MKATAVIGAGFGDEGKGLVTDFLAAQDPASTIVVRFNGGAQAGHTVVTPEGVRHVFSHYGAGSLAGVPTFLSRYFIANPYLWEKEHKQLVGLPNANTVMMIHPLSMLTTPYDMLVNQEIERHRGKKRHGSCGLGINETVRRCMGPLGTFAQHLSRLDLLAEVMWKIQKHIPKRMAIAGIQPSQEFNDRLDAIDIDFFIAACERMAKAVFIADTKTALAKPNIIFEGAQGLLLDEKHPFFPHVTRSRTGLTNVSLMAEVIGLKEIGVVYVTRSYMTRHGAGPFPSEDKSMAFADQTNCPNDWQGSLRFGELDLELMAEAINRDLLACPLQTNPSMAVTCLDQRTLDPRIVAHADALRVKPKYASYGPTRNDVREA